MVYHLSTYYKNPTGRDNLIRISFGSKPLILECREDQVLCSEQLRYQLLRAIINNFDGLHCLKSNPTQEKLFLHLKERKSSLTKTCISENSSVILYLYRCTASSVQVKIE